MPNNILRLYPGPSGEVELRGLYLRHALHRQSRPGRPFVYADFVSSLDGRIAVEDAVPPELSGANDLRLLLELQAQADCVITHAGYLRAIAEGRLGDILTVGGQPETRDLASWRAENGLRPQPAIVVASSTLDFPMPASIADDTARVLIATTRAAPAEKAQSWRERGYQVLAVGDGPWVDGKGLADALAELGHRSIFLLAGPRMLETMLRDRMLSRLYLTIVHRLIGGEAIHTMISGPRLQDPGRLRLRALYQDSTPAGGVGQWFAEFEPEA
jgi:riboflavin biosynthesis pyrimidine reductase